MAGAVESLLSIAGIGPARTATSSSLARSTSVVVAETRRTTATVGVVTTSSTARTSAVVTTASAAKSTMGPVQVTTVRSTSSIEKTTMRSTTIPISTTRVSSSSVSTSARSTGSVSVTTLTSTSTPSSSSSSSSASSTSARSTTVDTLGVPPVSATASAGAAEEGFKMSSGIIAAIVIASLLAVLALALVGYRYYKRHARKNSRRISGLSAWAGQGGWEGEDRYEKHEEDGTAGRWDGGEKERVSPFPVNAGPSQSSGYEQGYDHGYSHSGGYPPQSHYAPQQAYDNYQAQHAQAAPYQEFNKNLPLPPQPVSMGMAQPQAGWMPGTPHTFGSFASTDGVDPGAAASMAMSARDDPLAAARATGLNDGSEVVVKQGFVRSLDDELVIVVGEKLTLVQAYDDGWSLCEKVGPDGMMERGVVPLNCLEVFSGKTMAEESVSMPQPAVVGHIGKPEETSPVAGQEFLAMPSPSKAGKMTRSSTAHSLAVSERSERRSSLFLNAAAAGLWLQTQPSGAARP